MSNDTQVLRATLETALARIEDMLADDDGQAFKEARKFLESARQLSEQPEGMKLVPASPTMEARKHLEGKVGADFLIAYADWCRPLTASPTAPSTEASEPVLKWCNSCGEGVTTFCRAKTPGAERDCPFFDELGEVARTTPPPAPVLSDAEIEQAVKAARHPSGTLTPTDLARAIEQAIGRASRGAK